MNWRRTRSFFPVTRELVYLDHAGVAPISTRVAEALERYAAEATRRGAFDYAARFDAEVERVRARAALLIGAHSDEIAFVKNTTEGLGLVATGLDWRSGDQVVTCDLEYPSNVQPWWNLRRLGVETVMLRSHEGRLPLEEVERALAGPRVRLLSLSSVEFASGARNDLQALGALCRDRGVLFCVDAIQSLGCLPLDVVASHIDFLAADGHKWLLSVEGCGLFYCARRVLDLLQPRLVGWHSMRDRSNFDGYPTELHPSAGRFEEGTPNTAGIFALGAALDLLLELSVDAIAARVLTLTDRLAAGLAERGARLASPRAAGLASGIVAFSRADEDATATAARLRQRRIHVVTRRGRVRASPHFYNDPDEIDQLVAAVTAGR